MTTTSETFKDQLASASATKSAERTEIHALKEEEPNDEHRYGDSSLNRNEDDRDGLHMLGVGGNEDYDGSRPASDTESQRKPRVKKSKRKRKKRREVPREGSDSESTSYTSVSSLRSNQKSKSNKKKRSKSMVDRDRKKKLASMEKSKIRAQEDDSLINFTMKRKEAENDETSDSDVVSNQQKAHHKSRKRKKKRQTKKRDENGDVVAITILEADDDSSKSRVSDEETMEVPRERERNRRDSKSKKRRKKDRKDKRRRRDRVNRGNRRRKSETKKHSDREFQGGNADETEGSGDSKDQFFSTYPYKQVHTDGSSSTYDSVFTDVNDLDTASLEMDYPDDIFARHVNDLPHGFKTPMNPIELNIILKKHALNALQRRFEVIYNKNKFLLQLKEADSNSRKYEKREQKLDDELTQMREKTQALKVNLELKRETLAMMKEKVQKYREGYCDCCWNRKKQFDRMMKGCWNLTVSIPERFKPNEGNEAANPEPGKVGISSISTKTLLALQKQRLAVLQEEKDAQASEVYDEVQSHVSYDVFVMRKKMIDDAEGNRIEKDWLRIYEKNMKLATRFARNKVKYRKEKMEYLKLQSQTLDTAVKFSSDVCKMRDFLYATQTGYKSMERNFFDELVRNTTNMPQAEGIRYYDKSIYYLRALKLRQGMLYD